MNGQNELGQILSLLNKLYLDIRATNEKLERKIEESKEQLKKRNEQYFQLVKAQGNTARTIIVAAASVIIFSPVLGAVTDFVTKRFNW